MDNMLTVRAARMVMVVRIVSIVRMVTTVRKARNRMVGIVDG
jgi:hypothetical protein